MTSEGEKDALEEIVKVINRRGHAGMFARGGPITKEMVEIGVAKEWARSIEREFGLVISDVSNAANDPPDCYASISSRTIGIEITELVNGDVLRQISQGKNANSLFEQQLWNLERFTREINKRLDEKYEKYKKQKTSVDVLVIHTDEDFLSPRDIENWLREAKFLPREGIQSAYLLRTYFPGYREWWPVFKLYGQLT